MDEWPVGEARDAPIHPEREPGLLRRWARNQGSHFDIMEVWNLETPGCPLVSALNLKPSGCYAHDYIADANYAREVMDASGSTSSEVARSASDASHLGEETA